MAATTMLQTPATVLAEPTVEEAGEVDSKADKLEEKEQAEASDKEQRGDETDEKGSDAKVDSDGESKEETTDKEPAGDKDNSSSKGDTEEAGDSDSKEDTEEVGDSGSKGEDDNTDIPDSKADSKDAESSDSTEETGDSDNPSDSVAKDDSDETSESETEASSGKGSDSEKDEKEEANEDNSDSISDDVKVDKKEDSETKKETKKSDEEEEKKPGLLEKILDVLFPKQEEIEEEEVEEEATPSELRKAAEELVIYNTGSLEISVAEAEDFEEYGIGDTYFEEDGSYTIEIPEENPFFPYEVQFTVDGKKSNKWFLDPEDSVIVDGHKFFVSADFDDTAVTQMSLEVAGKTVVVYPEKKKFTNNPNALVKPQSLLPLREKNLEIDLTGFTPIELTSVSLDQIFTGNSEPADDAEIAWTKKWNDSYKKVLWKAANGAVNTVNLSYDTDNGWSTWEMIVGKADQLAASNIRYNIRVEMTDSSEWLIPTMYYLDKEGKRKDCTIKDSYYEDYSIGEGEMEIRFSGEDQDNYYLGLEINDEEYMDPSMEFDVWNEKGEKITEKLFSQDMAAAGAGYQIEDGEELTFRLRSVQNDTSRQLKIVFDIWGEEGEEGETENSISAYLYQLSGSSLGASAYRRWLWDERVGGNVYVREWKIRGVNAAKNPYRLVLEYTTAAGSKRKVTAAFEGYYSSIQEAQKAGAKDIKEALFDSNQGLTAVFEQGKYITVFEGTDSNQQERINTYKIVTEEQLSSSTYLQFSGLNDPAGNGIECQLLSQTMDSYADNAYITIEVAPDVDLTSLAPIFTAGDGAKVYAGGVEEISGVSLHDFSKGVVSYTVAAENGEDSKNYWLQVIKTGFEFGPLYINSLNDPEANTYVENGVVYSTREMLLDGRYGYQHDILLINIGEQDIPNLSAELVSDQVDLDWYWRLNGTYSLSGFKGTNYNNTENQAKLRFVIKDGAKSGDEISGTLTIKSGNTPLMVLNLTGLIGDPCITTKEIPNAVKYVHYGVMVQNNNRYSFNKVSYKLTGGSLPKGMELKSNGEIYGVPTEMGTFTFEVTMENSYSSFENSRATFTLIVDENTDENVENATDVGYALKERIPDIALDDTNDYTMTSIGEFIEWRNVYLDGVELVEGVDYTAAAGSTRLTIRNQTLKAHNTVGEHTISAEFRETGSGLLKRATQKYRVVEARGNSGNSVYTGSSSRDRGSHSSNAWSQEGGKWRYRNPNGTYVTNEWRQLSYNGSMGWYYFGADGYMVTGWLRLDEKTYYMNPESDGTQGMMCTGWKFIDGIWYFFDETEDLTQRGVMTTGGWHYLAYNGTMEWYFFSSEGQMQTGWVIDGDKKYYLYPVADGTRGRMLTGWQQIDGKEYYFNEKSDGTKGALMTSMRIGDRYVDGNGVRIR